MDLKKIFFKVSQYTEAQFKSNFGQYLHAYSLSFSDPSTKKLENIKQTILKNIIIIKTDK